MLWRRTMYYVSLDRVKEFKDGGFTTFIICRTKEHALQVFKKNPKHGQIDVRGYKTKPYCWKYWRQGKCLHNHQGERHESRTFHRTNLRRMEHT